MKTQYQNSVHRSNGGTALTNFNPKEYAIYQTAINTHGDSSFFIVKESYLGTPKGYYSLHREGKDGNASSFWETFRRTKEKTRFFTRTAPVYPDRAIQIIIDPQNPLSTQLEMITGDGWNAFDWSDTLKSGEITHLKSGLTIKIMN